jgi:hypothetical protein
MQQLETNAKEMDLICDELQLLEENIDDEFETFTQSLNTKRRQQQEENAKEVLKNAMSVEQARQLAAEKEAAAAAAAATNASEPKKVINNIINKINSTSIASQIIPNSQNISMSVTIDPNKKMAVPSIVNQNNNAAPSGASTLNSKQKTQQVNRSSDNIYNDDELNRFLNDSSPSSKPFTKSMSTNESLNKLQANIKPNFGQSDYPAADINQEEDEEDEDGISTNNPMVAAYKETLDSSDEEKSKNILDTQRKSTTNKKIVLKTLNLRHV